MTRTLRDTALMLDAMLGAEPGPIAALADATPRPLAGARLALSPRIGLVDVDPDVADGFEDALSALRRLGATIVEPPPPDTPLDVGQLFLEVVATDMLSWHAPLLAEKRDDYRQSNRDILDFARDRAMTGSSTPTPSGSACRPPTRGRTGSPRSASTRS